MILRNTPLTFVKLELKKTPSGKQFLVGTLKRPMAVKYRLGSNPEMDVHTDEVKLWVDSALYHKADISQEDDGSIVLIRPKMAIIPRQTDKDVEFWLE